MLAKPSVAPRSRISAVGHGLAERVHERDRAAGRDLHGLAAPGGGERGAAPPRTPGPSVSAKKPWPVSAARRPRARSRTGAAPSRCRISAACASSGSCAGWMRMLIFARAYGTTAFTALSTGSASRPRDGGRRPRPEPFAEAARAEERDARLDLGEVAELLLAVGRARSTPRAAGPSTATSPFSSCSVASAWSSVISASGAAPPNWPLCFGPASVRTSTITAAMPRRPTVSVGTPGRTLPMSAITIASQANSSGRDRRVGRERAAGLLLALDHDLDPDRRLAAPGPQGADVHEDVRLRVGRAAAVDRAVALASPRTAASPTSTRRRRARCRSARRGAPSARLRAPGSSAVMIGAASGRSSESICSTPASRSSSTTASCVSMQRRPRVLRIAEHRDRRDRDEPCELGLAAAASAADDVRRRRRAGEGCVELHQGLEPGGT